MKFSEVQVGHVFDASGIENPYAYDWQKTTDKDIYYPVMSSLNSDIVFEQLPGYTQCLADLKIYIAESTKVNPLISGSMIMGKLNATFASIHVQLDKKRIELAEQSAKYFNITKPDNNG